MSARLFISVDEKYTGKTVEYILKKEYGISSGMLIFLKNNSRLYIDKKVCRTVDICELGNVIEVDVSEDLEHFETMPLWNKKLDILYEDEFLFVVNKPGGMASHPCPGNRENSLANAVMYYWAQKGEYHNYHIVNRLDKDTSGICVIAKNRFAHGSLSGQIKNNIFKREYHAIVHGVLEPEIGVIDLPIGRAKNSILKRIVDETGKHAKTNYETIKTSKKGFSLLKIQLETGRTHQIRVHLSHIGHPLLGDWLYGNGDNEKEMINRQALHANHVSFLHPVTRAQMSFDVKLAYDMQNFLSCL